MRIDLGDDIVLNDGPDVNGVEWFGALDDGWSAAPLRRSITERPGAHGGWAGPGLYSPRVVGIEDGRIIAPDSAALYAAFDQLDALLVDPDDEWTFTVHEPTPKHLAVRREGRPAKRALTEVYGRFSFTAIATDPWKYGPELALTIGVPVGSSGGMRWPATFPLSFAAGTAGGTATVANDGPGPAKVVAEITNGVTNPRLTSDASSEYLELLTTVLAQDTLVVDFAAQTAKVGNTSRAATRTTTSRWWSLPPAMSSVVRFAASAFNADTIVTLRVSPAFP